MTARLALVLLLWSLAAVLASCTIRIPAADLCDYPTWAIARDYQARCNGAVAEPAIIVPRGTGWDDIG